MICNRKVALCQRLIKNKELALARTEFRCVIIAGFDGNRYRFHVWVVFGKKRSDINIVGVMDLLPVVAIIIVAFGEILDLDFRDLSIRTLQVENDIGYCMIERWNIATAGESTVAERYFKGRRIGDGFDLHF